MRLTFCVSGRERALRDRCVMSTLLPDPATLTDQLEHARDARDHLNRLITWLEQGLELVGASRAERQHEPLPEPGPDDAAVPMRSHVTPSSRATRGSSV